MALLLNVSALLGGDCGPCSGADNSDQHAIPKLHPSQNKTKYVQYSTNDARTILPKSISLLPHTKSIILATFIKEGLKHRKNCESCPTQVV